MRKTKTPPSTEIKEAPRSCDGCTKCCEGWLEGEVYGQPLKRGYPCRFMDAKGCSIYKQRPVQPCDAYKCAWMLDERIPRWMKPDMCGVILTWRDVNGIPFLDAEETDKKMDSSVLSWMFLEHKNRGMNIRYAVNGTRICIGTEQFIAEVNQLVNDAAANSEVPGFYAKDSI